MEAINIKYDEAKMFQMQSFLKYIDDVKKSNPGFFASKDFVYRELMRSGIKNSDLGDDRSLICCDELFHKWVEDYKDDPNLKVFVAPNWKSFCQFKNGAIDKDGVNDFIKLYIPLDKEHLYSGAKILFNYIESLGVEHASKIANYIRSDNVVVRLQTKDFEAAQKIIEFVNNNRYLKSGLNSPNPFVPTCKGIGIMRESGITYNGEIANNISGYISEINKDFNKDPSIKDFKKYVDDYCQLPEVKDILGSALGEKKQDLTEEQKRTIFFDALKTTYLKYDVNQISRALKEVLINNNYSFFSNGDTRIKYRKQLREIGQNSIRTYLNQFMSSFIEKEDVPKDIEAFVDEFVKRYFADDLAFKVDEACSVTLLKGGGKQLESALDYLVAKEDYSRFSRYYNGDETVNYRKTLMSLGKQNIIFGMEKSLASKGIDIRNIPYSNLISTYVGELDKSIYAKFEDTPKVSKM